MIHIANCKECSHSTCCYFNVPLTPEEHFWGYYMVDEELEEGGKIQLRKKDDGSCIYLNQHRLCSIYAHRPSICREYTCDDDERIKYMEQYLDGEIPILYI